MALSWQDHVLLIGYLATLLGLGLAAGRQRRSDEDYFLGGRRMPWLAIGVSLVASLVSSLTYLAEPGEVWKSGVTHVLGKLLGVFVALGVIWGFCIPFMMRFRYTSAYEYLGARFGAGCRRLGVALFVTMVVLWMGFVVLILSQVIERVAGLPLPVVIVAVGTVATLYTMWGGLRAVVWTDLIQVGLLVFGALSTIVFVGWRTGSGPLTWLATTAGHLAHAGQPDALPWFDWDPTRRATVVTVAAYMAVWQVCMHTSNQMTVQRYFSTTDAVAARRSALLSGVMYAAVNLLLVGVGLAVLHFYVSRGQARAVLDSAAGQDLIFPLFAVHELPAGFAGALLAALLAAAMSSVDSGANSIATVLSIELRGVRPTREPSGGGGPPRSHVRDAMWLTAAAGILITGSAFALTWLPAKWGIVSAIPRTFNAVTGPLGGLFLIGIGLPFVRQRAALVATLVGLAASLLLGYLEQLGTLLARCGLLRGSLPELSFAWILPASLVITVLTAILLARWDRTPERDLTGLVWWRSRPAQSKSEHHST